MKKNNKYIITAVSLLLLSACSKEMPLMVTDSITVEAIIGSMTKVAYSGNSTEFSAGDQIAVYGWTGGADAVPAKLVVNGVRNTLGTDGTWTPATQMLWKNGTDAHYFVGVYPARDITDFTADTYTLDPSTASYTASDLLMAAKLDGVKASAGTVMLKFDHAMAKLNVNLKFSNEFATTPTVSSVKVKARKTATINYLTKSVTATGIMSPVEIPVAATAATGYVYSYSGLQVPQDGVTTIIVAIAGNEYVYTSPTPIPLQSGKYTTLGLIVGRDNLELASVNVSNWTTASALSGGDADYPFKPTIAGHEYVELGEGLGLKWATCNIGAENPWDYGDYFAWGETKPYYTAGHSQDNPCNNWHYDKVNGYSLGSYLFYDTDKHDYTSYFPKDKIVDGSFFLKEVLINWEDDAATRNWGSTWRLPTVEEWDTIFGPTVASGTFDFKWETNYKGSSVAGLLVISHVDGYDGNSIFLPAAGYRHDKSIDDVGSKCYYWSASLDTLTGGSESRYLYSDSQEEPCSGIKPRHYGLSVRPVSN